MDRRAKISLGSSDLVQKSSTVLMNGIIVGAGIVLLITSLIAAYALNQSYISLNSLLASNGVSTTGIQVELGSIINLLSICPFGFCFGPWWITLGLLDQFSIRAKFAYKMKDSIISRAANGLMSGGSIAASLSGGYAFRQFYEPAFPPYEPFTITLLVGIIMLVTGILLLLIRKPK